MSRSSQGLQELHAELEGQAALASSAADEVEARIEALTAERDDLRAQLAVAAQEQQQEQQAGQAEADDPQEDAGTSTGAGAAAASSGGESSVAIPEEGVTQRVAELEARVAELVTERDALQGRLQEAEQQLASKDSALQDVTNRSWALCAALCYLAVLSCALLRCIGLRVRAYAGSGRSAVSGSRKHACMDGGSLGL
jgi:hypothetical protein